MSSIIYFLTHCDLSAVTSWLFCDKIDELPVFSNILFFNYFWKIIIVRRCLDNISIVTILARLYYSLSSTWILLLQQRTWSVNSSLHTFDPSLVFLTFHPHIIKHSSFTFILVSVYLSFIVLDLACLLLSWCHIVHLYVQSQHTTFWLLSVCISFLFFLY